MTSPAARIAQRRKEISIADASGKRRPKSKVVPPRFRFRYAEKEWKQIFGERSASPRFSGRPTWWAWIGMLKKYEPLLPRRHARRAQRRHQLHAG
jgi:hypothetical protein